MAENRMVRTGGSRPVWWVRIRSPDPRIVFFLRIGEPCFGRTAHWEYPATARTRPVPAERMLTPQIR